MQQQPKNQIEIVFVYNNRKLCVRVFFSRFKHEIGCLKLDRSTTHLMLPMHKIYDKFNEISVHFIYRAVLSLVLYNVDILKLHVMLVI